jgi:hypothetical protein
MLVKKYRIHCTLPNASDSINGIAFKTIDDGVESVDLHSKDVAERFRGINGYELIGIDQSEPKSRGRPRKEQPGKSVDTH